MNRQQGGMPNLRNSAPWLLASMLGVTVVSSVAVERMLSQLTQLTIAAIAGLLAAVLALLWAHKPLPRAVWVLGIPAAVLLVRALTEAPVRYSLVGLRTLPQGAALWIVAWLWVVLFALGRSAATARLVTAVIASIGALSGALAVWQEWTQSIREQVAAGESLEAIGIFGSSNALGQFTLLALACSVAWFAVARSRAGRVMAAICAMLSLGGLFVSVSRGSWAATVVGTAIALIVTKKTKPGMLAGGLLGGVVVGATALFAAGSGTFGGRIALQLNSVLNGRPVIWNRALAQWSEAMVFGEGPARFGTYVEWTRSSMGLDGVDAYGTFDPHSVPLAFAVAGGLIALVALIAAIGYVVFALAREVSDGTSVPQAALFGGLSALALTLVIEIAEVPSLIAGAALLGLLIRNPEPAAGEMRGSTAYSWRRLFAPALSCLLALAMLIPLAAALSNANAYRRLEKTNAADTPVALDYWTRTGDPSYATDHLGPLLGAAIDGTQPILSDEAHLLATSLEPANEWFIDSARMSALAWSLPGPQAPRGDEQRMRAAVQAGRQADPGNSAMWDIVEENNAALIKAWPAP